MKNPSKTNTELIQDITSLKLRIQQLEQSESEHREVEAALKESEARYRIAIEASNDGVAIVQNDVHVYVNQAFLKMFRYKTLDEIVGKHKYCIVHPDDYERVLNYAEVRQKGNYAPIRYEFKGIRKNNTPIDIEVSVNTIMYKKKRAILAYLRDITERKRVEGELKESEERNRIVVDSSNDGIAIMKGELHLYVNQRFVEIFGYEEPSEIIGKSISKTVHPDDFPLVNNINMMRQRGEPVPARYEFKGIKKDGTPIYIEISATGTMYQGDPVSLVYFRDITDRKEAEEEITREREKLKTLSDNAPFGMVLIDKEGHFTYINRKFTELFGYNLSEIPDGRTWFGKAYPDPKYRHMAISTWIGDLGDVEPGDRKPRVFTVACKDGTQRIVQIIASVLSTGDYLMTCEDITELRKLENQLRQSQKMEAIGTLAAGIAHDFNNVLTGIIGFTEMVYEDLVSDSPEQRRLGLVLKGAQRGRDLVKQILTFSRQTEQDRKPLALTKTIEEGLKILRPLFPSTIQIMSRSLTDDDMTLADPVQIHQVLMNLCTNAAHAMRDNGGILDISVSKTSLLESDPRPVPEMEPGEYIVLEVRDTGCGMTSETLECMFDPFFTTKKQGEGTGLGLSVVHGILKSHGGHVAVESKPGKGTVFHIYFPKVEEYTATEDKVVQATTGKNERILIIDDEDIIVELDKQRLSRLGYEVVATTSSVDALNIFRKEPDAFDLVITDQTMPHLTGMDLAVELQKIRATIPIILCTGHSETVSLERAKEAGIRAVLMKPLVKEELAQTIRRVLDTKREE